MKNDNLIFLKNEELDKNIYRVFSFERLKEIFDTRKITLVKPKRWEDPFENFILNSTGILHDGKEFEIKFRNSFYGQCWSLTKESDAMWRIYSQKKNGVKVKTTIRKLFTPLIKASTEIQKVNGNLNNLNAFVGKVKYQGTKKLIDMLNDKEKMSNKIFDQSGWGQASTFYYKRWAFRHEKEVRVMFNKIKGFENDFYSFKVDPNNLIDEVVFDPRMNIKEYNKCKSELESWGFKKKIIQSGLYKIKKFKLKVN